MKIKKITKGEIIPTWDIEVKEVHEFILDNGCVSHNTSSILGQGASYEAQNSNIFVRRVLSGEFIIVNKFLVKDLIKLGLWNESTRLKIINNEGSVQNIPEIPTNIKEIYKTVWEIKQKDIIDMSADRGAFIDQTQSLNLFMDKPNFAKLTSMHFYSWGRRPLQADSNGNLIIPDGAEVINDKNGKPKFIREDKTNLKTGIYYLRIKGASNAVRFTTENKEEVKSPVNFTKPSDDEDCVVCSA